MTKLQVRVMSQSVNGPLLMLCDEAGNPLPNQEKVELYNSVSDVPKVGVTFVIDNDMVRLVGPEK
jgi:ABC-type ATPase involved in cell division